MKCVTLLGTVLVSCYAALGQGEFLFNSHDPAFGNDIRFSVSANNSASFASGPDLFVEVLAGPDQSHLMPLTPLLPLDQPGAAAGYTNPFGQVFTTDMPSGTRAYIAYRMFEGASWNTASAGVEVTTTLGFPGLLSVTLTSPPDPPNEVRLGTAVIVVPLSEPAPLILCVTGLVIPSLLRRLRGPTLRGIEMNAERVKPSTP
jgi:hypothetical protein